ncbi:MAG TPA: hypothetical protein VFC44_12305 [Candidatus Saccharimonadales bacterium]|nr:hypothetical protein [Candidatus Saccharimonadales bacterium]
MTSLKDLSIVQLQRAIEIKEKIEALQNQLESIEGGETPILAQVEAPDPVKRKYHMTSAHKQKLVKALAKARAARWAKAKSSSKPAKKGKRKLSVAGRAAIIAATKARWAKIKGTATKADKPAKKRKTSAAVKAKLRAIAKARWAKAKAAGKKTL